MYEVQWVESAVLNLADAWTKSDSLKRTDITAASHRIDEILTADPLEAGESRSAERRVYIDLPLVVTYEVDPGRRLVTVLDVIVSRRHRGDIT